MHTHTRKQRHFASILPSAIVCSTLLIPTAASAAGNAAFELRPHCYQSTIEEKFGGPLPDVDQMIKLGEGTCTSFEVRDPENKQTPVLQSGNVLDIDLVIHNPDRKPINRFRAWITYDASALDGVEVDISSDFPSPTPGEDEFVRDEGFLKLSGSSNTSYSDELIVVARVRIRVTNPVFDGTPLTYFDISGTTDSKTGIFEESGSSDSNIMVNNPGYLYVRFLVPTAAQSSNAGTTSSAPSTQSSTAPTTSAVFSMLQVQGLRVTTEGSSVFLAWDALPSAELVGYNLYYGTTTGRYIQRRGVDKDALSMTIRGLPVGETYYFAIRGVNAADEETEFSQEVAISVGNPATSTSPLSGNSIPTKTPASGGSVAGETGASSVLMILLMISAVAGTVFAFRRQSGL